MRSIILLLLFLVSTSIMAQVNEGEKESEEEQEEMTKEERRENERKRQLEKMNDEEWRQKHLESEQEANETSSKKEAEEKLPENTLPFPQLVDSFLINYQALNPPEIMKDYVQTINQVSSQGTLDEYDAFVKTYQFHLDGNKRYELDASQQIDYDLIQRLLDQLSAYTTLRSQMLKNGEETLPGGLSQLSNGDQWYAFFFKYYNGGTYTGIHKLKAYGDTKARLFQQEIDRYMDQMGYEDSASFYGDIATGQIYFIQDKGKLLSKAKEKVKNVRMSAETLYGIELPELQVKLSDQGNRLDADNQTVYLHLPENGYPVRDLDFDIIQLVAGHHLLHQLPEAEANLLDLINTDGFENAWALYTTGQGKRFQLYRKPITQLGEPMNKKRLAVLSRIDVGIHLDGWDQARALSYYQSQLPWLSNGQAVINEIMKRPALHSVTPWNSFQIENTRVNAPVTWGTKIMPKDYYNMLLSQGILPIDMIFDRVEQAAKE